jgi:fucose 4-O-acetylase-like acetyltransferase
VISLGSGLIDIPNVLAIHKTVAFLPFYVIGLHLTREHFLRLGTMRIRAASIALLGGLFVFCQLVRIPDAQAWLLWKNSYVDLGTTFAEGLLIRAGLIALGLLMTFAALSLVPRRRSWTTSFGERTFYCYLLHGFVIIWLDRHFHLWDQLEPYGVRSVAGLIIAAIVLANLLMTPIVARVFRPVFEPRLTWMFRPIDESPQVKIPD